MKYVLEYIQIYIHIYGTYNFIYFVSSQKTGWARDHFDKRTKKRDIRVLNKDKGMIKARQKKREQSPETKLN